MNTIMADITDENFQKDPRAILVKGYYWQDHIAQFGGSGYSPAEYKFKALMVDGVVYIPNQETRRAERKPEAREMVVARHQPPKEAIEYVCFSSRD